MNKKFVITDKAKGHFENDPIEQLFDGQILCRPISVGLCGSDRLIFSGDMPNVRYPRVPCHEVSAIVLEDRSNLSIPAGTAITVDPYKSCGVCHACQIGRFNCCKNNQTLGVQRDGVLREKFIINSDKVYILPENIDARIFCLTEPLTLALHVVDRAGDVSNKKCLVAGVGNVGRLVTKVLSNYGAEIIAWDISDDRLQDAINCGAHFTINANRKDAYKRVYEITQNEGVSISFETAGQSKAVEDCIKLTAFAGKVILVGHSKQVSNIYGSDIVFKELDILGSRNSIGQFQNAINMIKSDPEYWESLISHRFPFEDSLKAFNLTQNPDASYTKIVIDF